MRKITLHSPTIDRHGNFRDAGDELLVGTDTETSDIDTAEAKKLIQSRRAVTAAKA